MSFDKKKERRMIVKPLEVRAAADEGQLPTIEGYAAVYNQVATIGGMFAERIMPGAAKQSLTDPDSMIIACFNHDDDDVPLARYKAGSGTLSLREDQTGLFVSFQPANTQLGRDVVESIRRGDTDGMSIGFYVEDDDWNGNHNGMTLRTISKMSLSDICVTPMPAYGQTSDHLKLRTKRNGEFSTEDYQALMNEKKQPSEKEKEIQVEAEARKRRLQMAAHRAGKKPYGDVKYADPGFQSDKQERYPLDDEDHIRSAWDYIHKTDDRDKYTASQLAHIESAIEAAWKEKIDPAGPPGAKK
jgi:HK97 family phage prohead protease